MPRPNIPDLCSDLPNIPSAWDRELKELMRADLSAEALAKISAVKAVDFAIASDEISDSLDIATFEQYGFCLTQPVKSSKKAT